MRSTHSVQLTLSVVGAGSLTRSGQQTLSVVGAVRNQQKDGQMEDGDKEMRDVTGRQVRAGERVSELCWKSLCQ